MIALYQNEGKGLFIDEAPASTIGKTSLLTLTFACFFFDYDLDGKLDIFAANGHVADDISTVQPRVEVRAAAAPVPQHRQPPLRSGDGQRRRRAPGSDGRPRRGLWRLRRRRRSGSAGDHQQRPGAAAAQRRRRAQPPPAPEVHRHEVESRRHRHVRARDHGRRPLALADGQDRFELSFAERAAADVRTRQRGRGHRRSRSSGRTAAPRRCRASRPNVSLVVEEGKGIVSRTPFGTTRVPASSR